MKKKSCKAPSIVFQNAPCPNRRVKTRDRKKKALNIISLTNKWIEKNQETQSKKNISKSFEMLV